MAAAGEEEVSPCPALHPLIGMQGKEKLSGMSPAVHQPVQAGCQGVTGRGGGVDRWTDEPRTVPWTKAQVQAAVPWEPPGCIGPTEPLVGVELEPSMWSSFAGTPLRTRLMGTGGSGFPAMVCCCAPVTPPWTRSWACPDLTTSLWSEARKKNAMGPLTSAA